MNSAEASWLHTLYITYAETLYRIACYRLQDANRAQDPPPQRFPGRGPKGPRPASPRKSLGWLLRALNYELSHEFARQAKQTAQEQPLHPSPPVWHRRRPRPWGWPRCCRSSSPRDREILLLFYEEGLSYQEIAQRLGVLVSTCGTWLSWARKHCRAYLSHSPVFPIERCFDVSYYFLRPPRRSACSWRRPYSRRKPPCPASRRF